MYLALDWSTGLSHVVYITNYDPCFLFLLSIPSLVQVIYLLIIKAEDISACCCLLFVVFLLHCNFYSCICDPSYSLFLFSILLELNDCFNCILMSFYDVFLLHFGSMLLMFYVNRLNCPVAEMRCINKLALPFKGVSGVSVKTFS